MVFEMAIVWEGVAADEVLLALDVEPTELEEDGEGVV